MHSCQKSSAHSRSEGNLICDAGRQNRGAGLAELGISVTETPLRNQIPPSSSSSITAAVSEQAGTTERATSFDF